MKPKQYPAQLALQNLRAAVKFTVTTRLGLVLVAFGLPLNDGWLAADLPRGIWKSRRQIGD
ncbi:MAG: hypothetical protein ABSG80_05450 [Verrucomicrobiota bacterium]|jgi:hypothetical protein